MDHQSSYNDETLGTYLNYLEYNTFCSLLLCIWVQKLQRLKFFLSLQCFIYTENSAVRTVHNMRKHGGWVCKYGKGCSKPVPDPLAALLIIMILIL